MMQFFFSKMLVFFVLSFLLFASPVIESELLLNSSNSTLINSNESSLGMLSSDTTAAAEVEAFGNGVLIKSKGKAELILTDRTLKIKADIAERCIGHVQICFPYSDDEESDAKNVCPGLCAFNIESNTKGVDFIYSKGIAHETCNVPIHMQNGRKTDYCGTKDYGCDPLIDADTNKIAIEVTYMTYNCSVFIDNAQIAPPKPTPSVPLIAGPSEGTTETANASGQLWYAWVILTVSILFVVALIVGCIVCWRKKILFFKNSGDSNMDSQASKIVPKSAIIKAQTEKSKDAAAEVKTDKKQKKAAKKDKSLKTAQEATLEAKTPPSPHHAVINAPPAPVQKPRVKVAPPPSVPAKSPPPIHDYHEFEAPQELQQKIDRQEEERQRRIRSAAMQPQLQPGDICKPQPRRRSTVIQVPPHTLRKPPSRKPQKQNRRSHARDTRESSTEET